MAQFDPQPFVSIVVTIRNGGLHFPTCLASLLQLSYPAERMEIHLVDDFSTDGTREYLQQQTLPDFLRVHYPDENLGRTKACNLGLSFVKGDVIILLDGDMEVQPDFVDQHLAALAKPGREAVVGRIEPAPWVPGTKLNRYLYESPLRGAKQFGSGRPISFQYLIFSNAALSRAALEAGGAFEETFTHFGGKDILFAYRIARTLPNGIYYNDAAPSLHHQDRELSTQLALMRDYGYHNLSQIMHRHPEIATPLAADLAWPFDDPLFRRRRRMGRLIFNPFCHTLARMFLVITPHTLSNVIIRYLIVGSVVQGLRRYVHQHNIPRQIPGPNPTSSDSVRT
ncbi:glycosyltransferase [Candidatus Neomarinimicrobiota bacterium]